MLPSPDEESAGTWKLTPPYLGAGAVLELLGTLGYLFLQSQTEHTLCFTGFPNAETGGWGVQQEVDSICATPCP